MNTDSIPTLATVLTPFPYYIDDQASLNEAKKSMEEHEIRHLIVMRDGDIDSLISGHDIHYHEALYGADNYDQLKVSDVCVNNIVLADIHDPLDKVLEAMTKKHLSSVVVLRNGELAGIFTTSDACHHFARFLQKLCKDDDIPDILA